MPTVTVKNIPPDVYDHLKRLAEANRRSINSQIIACIEQAVYSRRLDPDTVLANARALREKKAIIRSPTKSITRQKVPVANDRRRYQPHRLPVLDQ